ncbi:MAG: hypothetical protein AABZ53_05320 [Planctomycetota bacterium]
MSYEHGALFQLIDYGRGCDGDPTGGNRIHCEIIPESSICDKCGQILNSWYPREAPTVRLHLVEECTRIGLLGLPVLHESVFDVLRPYLPDALATRCSSNPASPMKIGSKYVALSMPDRYWINIYRKTSRPWLCTKCNRWLVPLGALNDRLQYCALEPDQRDQCAFFRRSGFDLVVSAGLRAAIESLDLSEIGWQSIRIYGELPPENRLAVTDDG